MDERLKLTLKERDLRGPVKEVRVYKTRKKFFFFGNLVKSEIVERLKFHKTDHLFYELKNPEMYSSHSEDFYTYDSNWQLLLFVKCYIDNSLENISKYYYDEQGRISKIVDNEKEYINTYDESGNVVKQLVTSINGHFDCWYLFSYDSCGRLVEDSERGENGELYNKTVYEYDHLGRLIKETYLLGDETIDSTEYFSFSNQYKYNKYGDLEESVLTDENGTEKRCFSYEYDSHSNWVKQTAIISKNLDDQSKETTVLLREIEYY